MSQLNTAPLDAPALEWLASRGIPVEVAEVAGVKACQHWTRAAGGITPCVAFPYRDDKGGEYAWKVRTASTAKGHAAVGAPQTLWLMDLCVLGEPLIITEGEPDALALRTAGIGSVTSVPNGAPAKVSEGRVDPKEDGKFRYVWHARKLIHAAPYVVIATDADEPGQALAEELARRIGKAKCRRATYPDGCKDANDVLTHHGAEELARCIHDAEPWPVVGLYGARHYAEQVQALYENGVGRGESTGYPVVDEYMTIAPGMVTIVTGVPSSGKSEFLDQIMINLARTTGWKFAVCSFENPPPLHVAKLSEKLVRAPFFTGPTARMSREDLARAAAWIDERFLWIECGEEPGTIDSILERASAAVMRLGIRGLVIDPYNYVERDTRYSETDWVSAILSKIRAWAIQHDAHVWFVAHPAKMMRGEGGSVPVPKGYDISGSAAWYSKADLGVTVHRGAEPGVVEVHVWKCRWRWMGKQGVAILQYDPVTGTYSEPVERMDDLGAIPADLAPTSLASARRGGVAAHLRLVKPYKDDDDDDEGECFRL